MKLRKVIRANTLKDKIFAEDCFKTMSRLKDNEVSVILTSPPYNNSKHTYTELSRSRHESRYDVYVDTGSHEDYIEWTEKLFSEFDRILCENGVVLYNINYGTGYDNTCDNLIDTIHTITTRTPFMVADIIGWKKSSALPNNTSSNKCTRIFELVFVLCRKTENKTFISNKGVKSTNEKTGQNLRSIVLNNNKLGNTGIIGLTNFLITNKVLSFLSVQNCEIGIEGIKTFLSTIVISKSPKLVVHFEKNPMIEDKNFANSRTMVKYIQSYFKDNGGSCE